MSRLKSKNFRILDFQLHVENHDVWDEFREIQGAQKSSRRTVEMHHGALENRHYN